MDHEYIGVKIPPDVLADLKRVAADDDRTISSFVRQAIRAALSRRQPVRRQPLPPAVEQGK
jgi:metal-responsive CopG/Arc/MetJ family transcriptional regulator